MRLIDADALMQTLGITDTDCGECDLHGAMGCSKRDDFVDACMAIEDAPTIEERKKGMWIEVTDHEIPIVCKCSVCEWRTKDYDWFSYCPHCGADMRGENDGE